MHYIEALEQFRTPLPAEENDRRLILEYARKNPVGILTRESELYHMTASSMVINQAFDKVLMAYHNIYDSWAWTGGHADGEDDLMKLAVREAQEETGIQTLKALFPLPVSVEILHVPAHIKRGRQISTHLHLNVTYALIGDENEPLSAKPDENARVGWLAIDRLGEFVREKSMLPVYRKILSRMLQPQTETISTSLK